MDDVAKHDPDLVRQFWSQHYVPERMVAIVCGNHPDAATAGQFGRLARRYAEYYLAAAEGAPLRTPAGQRRRRRLRRRRQQLQRRPPLPSEHSPFRLQQLGPQLRAHLQETDQCHTVIAYPTPFGQTDPQHRAAELACDMLGGYMSSRLWSAIREKNGWAYSVAMYFEGFAETGVMFVHMGLKTKGKDGKEDPAITREALLVALRELEHFEPTAEDLATAQGHRRGQLAMSAERSAWLAQFYAQQLLHGESARSVDQELAAYGQVTLAEVRALVRAVLRPERCTLCFIGRTGHTREQLRRVADEKGLASTFVDLPWDEKHSDAKKETPPAPPSEGAVRTSPK